MRWLKTQEGNNAAARGVQIGGDLVVSALTVPAKGGAGVSNRCQRHNDQPGSRRRRRVGDAVSTCRKTL